MAGNHGAEGAMKPKEEEQQKNKAFGGGLSEGSDEPGSGSKAVLHGPD